MTKRAVQLLAATILCAAGLTGCGQTSVHVAPPPPELTACADEPVAPELPPRDRQGERDRLTLDYILSLRSAWGDCRAKVDGLRAWGAALGN